MTKKISHAEKLLRKAKKAGTKDGAKAVAKKATKTPQKVPLKKAVKNPPRIAKEKKLTLQVGKIKESSFNVSASTLAALVAAATVKGMEAAFQRIFEMGAPTSPSIVLKPATAQEDKPIKAPEGIQTRKAKEQITADDF